MDKGNVILKSLFYFFSAKTGIEYENLRTENFFKNFSPFQLINVISKNKLFIVGLILLILYAWFIRTNISLGAILGFFVLGTVFYIYYQYESYQIKDFTNEKQQRTEFLSKILVANRNVLEGSLYSNKNYFDLDDDQIKDYLYFNPAVVDFYYNNKIFVKHSIYNFVMSLGYINAMIKLEYDIRLGTENRGAQLEELIYLRQQCLNYWQSIVINLPSTRVSNMKFQESLEVLGELTQRYIDTAQLKIIEQNVRDGVNTQYYPIVKTGPRPNDIGTFGYNNHFDFFT